MLTVGYLRVSTATQAKQHGIEAQRSACVAWAVANGLEIGEWYVDVATGSNENREDFQRMKEAVEAGNVARIIVYSLDRLGRDLVAAEITMKELQAKGTQVVSATQTFDPTPSGNLLRQMTLAFAEYERALIKARLAGGRKVAKALGKWAGGIAPYGFKSVGNAKLEPVECEMVVVRRVLREIDAGHSIRETAALVQASGRTGQPLQPSVVAKIANRRDLYQTHLAGV